MSLFATFPRQCLRVNNSGLYVAANMQHFGSIRQFVKPTPYYTTFVKRTKRVLLRTDVRLWSDIVQQWKPQGCSGWCHINQKMPLSSPMKMFYNWMIFDFLTDNRNNAESLNAFFSKSRFRAKSNIRQYGMSATVYRQMYFVSWKYIICFWGARSRSICTCFVGTFGVLAPHTKKLATLKTTYTFPHGATPPPPPNALTHGTPRAAVLSVYLTCR